MSVWPMDEKTKSGPFPLQQYYPNPNAPVPSPYPSQFQPMPGNLPYPPQPYPVYQQPVLGHPQYPPQPYHAQGPARSLQVEFTSWTSRHLAINEVGQGSLVYAADLHNRNPQMEFKMGATNTPFATVHMRSLKPEMDIRLHGCEINLRVKSCMKHQTTYMSIAFPNTYLTWKCTSAFKYLDFECVDQNSVVVARFKPHSSLSMRKLGRLDILIPPATSGAAMDELMITGVAFMYYAYLTHTRNTVVAVA
ncbi:hypothetical protein ETB97_001535 [Aspergillus alliaceus]|uniref:Uncharacterized protein n=1 Tax=Petromyces alliaceus TaxID=209559 RepID=A0A8H6ADU6_PETAA|nr:hypothetical protein ETB97_001535 [Aspergillus burnettii]